MATRSTPIEVLASMSVGQAPAERKPPGALRKRREEPSRDSQGHWCDSCAVPDSSSGLDPPTARLSSILGVKAQSLPQASPAKLRTPRTELQSIQNQCFRPSPNVYPNQPPQLRGKSEPTAKQQLSSHPTFDRGLPRLVAIPPAHPAHVTPDQQAVTRCRKVYRKPLRQGSEVRILDCKAFKINALDARQTFTRTSPLRFIAIRNRLPNHKLALAQRLAEVCLTLSVRKPAAAGTPLWGLARLDRAGLAQTHRTSRP